MDDLVIGVDLGTTNSCVSLYMNGRTKILENSEGGRITSSFIFFTDLQETIVGEHAKRMASGKPNNGIYEVKRLVGRRFEDAYLQNNLKYLPFEVEPDVNGDPVITVKQKDKTVQKTPRELCTIILNKLINDTEAKLGQVINKAVITVPAYFNVKQREVTLAAAEDAGLTVLKLLNEPTAAALAYYFENDCNKTSYCLVYDLGGGTFDVAILKKSWNNINIVGVDGDTQLGGHDFDNIIVNYVCEKLIEEYNYDPKKDKENLRRLHNKCEDAKKALSSVQETTITLIGFVPNYPCVQITLTREQFESIGEELFQRTIDIVDSCMKSCCIFKSTIKEVILCGGSTRIPKIQQMISDYFDGKVLNKFVNPDECVAEGAALQAAMLSKSSKQKIDKMTLRDVVPLSLGVGISYGLMDFVIKKNSPIPISAEVNHVTSYDEQESILYSIYEGERTNAKKNRLIGEFVIRNLTPAPPGQCKVKFSMNIDENGILTVRAEEMFKNSVKELTIKYTRGNQSESEIKNTLLDAEQYKEEDQLFKEFIKMKKYLLQYCICVKYNLKEKNLVDIHKNIYDFCLKMQTSGHTIKIEEANRVKEMTKMIEQRCEPLIDYYQFKFMPQREN